MWQKCRLVVAVGEEDVLAVGVPVDVEFYSGGGVEGLDEVGQARILGGVRGRFAGVGFGAWIRRGAARVGVPREGPVAVDVAADAG